LVNEAMKLKLVSDAVLKGVFTFILANSERQVHIS